MKLGIELLCGILTLWWNQTFLVTATMSGEACTKNTYKEYPSL